MELISRAIDKLPLWEVHSCGSYHHWDHIVYRSLWFMVSPAACDFQSLDFKPIRHLMRRLIASSPQSHREKNNVFSMTLL
jgi:hypothetical protein